MAAADYMRRGLDSGGDMNLSLIVLGLVGWVLVQLVALVLMRMSSDQDRVARHQEKLLIPFSDVEITQQQDCGRAEARAGSMRREGTLRCAVAE